MEEDIEKIIFTTEDNEEIEFYVIEQTTINGSNYLLVADSIGEEEADALLLKEAALKGEEIVYEMIEDEEELRIVSEVFEELLEDFNIEL